MEKEALALSWALRPFAVSVSSDASHSPLTFFALFTETKSASDEIVLIFTALPSGHQSSERLRWLMACLEPSSPIYYVFVWFLFSSVSGVSSLQSLRHAFLGRGELAWVQMVTKVTHVVNAFCQWWWLKGWLVAVLPSAGQSLPWTLSCRSCSPGVDLRKPSQLPVIRGLIAACSIKGPGLATFSLSSPRLHVTDRLLGWWTQTHTHTPSAYSSKHKPHYWFSASCFALL